MYEWYLVSFVKFVVAILQSGLEHHHHPLLVRFYLIYLQYFDRQLVKKKQQQSVSYAKKDDFDGSVLLKADDNFFLVSFIRESWPRIAVTQCCNKLTVTHRNSQIKHLFVQRQPELDFTIFFKSLQW